MLRGAIERLERVLTAVAVEHDGKEYFGAGLVFLNDHDGSHSSFALARWPELS